MSYAIVALAVGGFVAEWLFLIFASLTVGAACCQVLGLRPRSLPFVGWWVRQLKAWAKESRQ